jgi:dienelactone hydrolase
MTANTHRASGARTRRLRTLACFVAMLVAMAWGSAPASAAIIEHSKFGGPYDFVDWSCGYAISVAGVDSHNVLIRADKKADGIVFVTDNYEYRETWTGPDGRWFTVSGNALAKDVKAESLGGTLYKFTFHNAGQPTTITDSSGALVVRERGSISFSYTIDLADGTFNFVGARASGPHALFDVDACYILAPLVGTDSARYLTPRPLGSTSSHLGYYEYLPPSYRAAGDQSPLLVFLNGYGENGDGSPEALGNLLFTAIPRFIAIGGWPTDRPLVVLAPQHVEDPPGFDFGPCDGEPWGGSCNMQVQHDLDHASPAFCWTPDEVHDFLTYALDRYNVDPTRVYLTGLSCGGFGTWEYLAKYRDQQVAAAVPYAGEGRMAWADAGCGLGSVPIWALHGELDDVVNPLGSIEPMHHLADCPGLPADERKLTIYEGLYHEGWDQAYSGALGDDIYSWMLGFSNP